MISFTSSSSVPNITVGTFPQTSNTITSTSLLGTNTASSWSTTSFDQTRSIVNQIGQSYQTGQAYLDGNVLQNLVNQTGQSYATGTVPGRIDILYTANAQVILADQSNGTSFALGNVTQNDPKEVIRSVMKQNYSASWRRTRNNLITVKVTPEEQKARDLLRDMLTEADWRRYLTNGFIMVKGQSGKWYQICARGGVYVYVNNKRINYLCIHTDEACPPTDHVLNMKMLAEIDEDQLWAGANVSSGQGFSFAMTPPTPIPVSQLRPKLVQPIYTTTNSSILAFAC